MAATAKTASVLTSASLNRFCVVDPITQTLGVVSKAGVMPSGVITRLYTSGGVQYAEYESTGSVPVKAAAAAIALGVPVQSDAAGLATSTITGLPCGNAATACAASKSALVNLCAPASPDTAQGATGGVVAIYPVDDIADRPLATAVPAGSLCLDTDETVDPDALIRLWMSFAVGAARQWVGLAGGSGYVLKGQGTGTLVGGTLVVTPGQAVSASTRILLQRKNGLGGGFALGELTPVSLSYGAPNVGTFTVDALNPANGALLAADLSTFDWFLYDQA